MIAGFWALEQDTSLVTDKVQPAAGPLHGGSNIGVFFDGIVLAPDLANLDELESLSGHNGLHSLTLNFRGSWKDDNLKGLKSLAQLIAPRPYTPALTHSLSCHAQQSAAA